MKKRNISKNLLEDLYLVKKLDVKSISKLLKCSISLIRNRFKEFGIKNRSRKEFLVWNRGLTKETNIKIAEAGSKISKTNKGRSVWNYGLTAESDTRVEMNRVNRLKSMVFKKGKDHYNFNQELSEETKSKISLGHGGTGIPYEKANYPAEFQYIKQTILKRDNYTCQNPDCNMISEEHYIVYGTELNVHHIDYDKTNNFKWNLITTCFQCNIRANFNRSYWQKFYTNLVKV